ncbi:hypothetical protein DXG03_002620 [Asterophora parasitica]|uniref:DUF2828 domain containing protein n=1 Tax=Asterophora parasitica TaxID=117018 RepID=A0A9P7G257_9AGAR|nr:hypothetical protein DXG03_002620 [Asterophora parasitica]
MLSTLAAASSCQTVTLPEIPELYDSNFLDVLLPAREDFEPIHMAAETEPGPKNAMMEALKGTTNQTLTQNLAPAYSSTASPTLNAFQLLASAHDSAVFNKQLKDAWAEDPQLTLRIIWNIRSIHDGKGDKEQFYKAFGWLYEHHPRTAISNLRWLVEPVCTTPKSKSNLGMAHGYWKDPLNILALAATDELRFLQYPARFLHTPREPYKYGVRRGHYGHKKSDGNEEESKARVAASLANNAKHKEVAREKRVRVAGDLHAKLVTKLAEPKFRALYIAIARLFSARLAEDLDVLSSIEALPQDAADDRFRLLKKISLAGKWAPTPFGSHDRYTNISTAIVLLLRHAHQTPGMFPSALNNLNLGTTEAAHILRSFYQRWVLTPLRAASCCPEPLMSAKRWKEIRYTRVPSVCMKNNMERFFEHDPRGFQAYLAKVESGKKTISGATLFPHELVTQALALGAPVEFEEGEDIASREFGSLKEVKQALKTTQVRVVEAQWKSLIERLREHGSIDNAIAVCDVSGSMGSVYGVSHRDMKRTSDVQPIIPALALSLVLASLAKPPFNAGFITFSSQPQFVKLDLTKPLHTTLHEMENADWEMNTDFNKVFVDLLLPFAVKNKVPQEEMIKRVFVFSDMQFDAASKTSHDAGDWTTNHDAVARAYAEAGYEVPQIVYWDLARFGTMEVQADREGVAMMNGFSTGMMKTFMGEAEEEAWVQVEEGGETTKSVQVKEEFNPVSVMRKAVGRKSYDCLVVVD